MDLCTPEKSIQCSLWSPLASASHKAISEASAVRHPLVSRGLPRFLAMFKRFVVHNPLESTSEKLLTLKLALLSASTSFKRVEDSVSNLFLLRFSLGIMYSLHTELHYKGTFNNWLMLQAIFFSPHESPGQERLHLLCPVRAVRIYIHCLGQWPMSVLSPYSLF